MQKIKPAAVLFLTTILLSLSGSLYAAGTAAKLSTDIKWPKNLYFMAPMQGVVSQSLSSSGASSSTVNSAAEKERRDKKSEIQQIEDFNIDFKKIVTDAFSKEMIAKGIYDGSSSNELQLKVVLYGYSHKGGFNIDMVPMLKVKAKLVDANGKRLWKGTGGVSTFGKPVAKAEYYDLLKSKETARSLFVAAAERAAHKALKKYK